MLSSHYLCVFLVMLMYHSVLGWKIVSRNLGRFRNVHLATSQQIVLPNTDRSRGISSSKAPPNSESAPKSNAAAKTTGVLAQTWPTVHPAATHFKRALMATKVIKPDPSIKNARQAQRKYTAMYIDGLMKALNAPLTKMLSLYEKGGIKRLHPYEVWNIHCKWI